MRPDFKRHASGEFPKPLLRRESSADFAREAAEHFATQRSRRPAFMPPTIAATARLRPAFKFIPEPDPQRVSRNWAKICQGHFYTELLQLLGGPAAGFPGFNPETGLPNPGCWRFSGVEGAISISVFINEGGCVESFAVQQRGALPAPSEALVAANWQRVRAGLSHVELVELLGGPATNISGFNPQTRLPNPGIWLFGSSEAGISISVSLGENGLVRDCTVGRRTTLPTPNKALVTSNWPYVRDGQTYMELMSLLGGPSAYSQGFGPATGLPNAGTWLFGDAEDPFAVSAWIDENGFASDVKVRQRVELPACNESLVAANWTKVEEGQTYLQLVQLLGGPSANYAGFDPRRNLPNPGIWIFSGPGDEIVVSVWMDASGYVRKVGASHPATRY